MINDMETEFSKRNSAKKSQKFYGNGKLLLTGEYFVLDGALSLALPTKFGQNLTVSYRPSFNPTLIWKSYNEKGELWFESEYEFWHFRCLKENPCPRAILLQNLLLQARKENNHFLRENVDVEVTTQVDFSLDWGLGSSSTHIFNIAQWAYVSPFKLLFETLGGSGYDIACAQADGPILYQLQGKMPSWSLTDFCPNFKDSLYFVYLGKKKDSVQGIKEFRAKGKVSKEDLNVVTALTNAIMKSETLEEFEELIKEHEDFVANYMDIDPIRKRLFPDYWGEIKSLGAWGGDFILATSDRPVAQTKDYFRSKLGHEVIFSYKDMILERSPLISKNQGIDDSANGRVLQ